MKGISACAFFQTNLDNSLPLKRAENSLPPWLWKKVGEIEARGKGDEISLDLPVFLPAGKIRIGGQAGNAAHALSKLGVRTILSVNSGKREISRHAGQVILMGKGGPARVHHALEGKRNRTILTYDPENSSGKIPEEFERAVLSRKIDFALAGGLQLAKDILPSIRLSKALRKRGAFVHFEFNGREGLDGKGLLNKVNGAFDSIGMNCAEAVSVAGKNPQKILGLSGARILVVHGEKSSSAYFREKEFPEKAVRDALLFGGKVASGKALSGRDLSESALVSLEKKGLLSPPKGKGSSGRLGGFNRITCPSWKIGERRTSLGLGDSFAAGFCLELFRGFCALQK